MDLFHFQEEAPADILAPKWLAAIKLCEYIREFCKMVVIKIVRLLVDQSLWEQSGHMAKFDDDMFMTSAEHYEYVVNR